MPALFIANTAKQDNAFTYKVPEQARGHHKVDIPAGGQVKLNNLSGEAVKSIIEQHAGSDNPMVLAAQDRLDRIGKRNSPEAWYALDLKKRLMEALNRLLS